MLTKDRAHEMSIEREFQLEAELERVRAAVSGEGKTCATCRYWWAWRRPDAKDPLDSTKGDCHHPGLRGRLNGMDETFGCKFHQPAAPQEDSQ